MSSSDSEDSSSAERGALAIGIEVLQAEAAALAAVATRLGPSFEHVVERIAICPGRLVVSGMGKAGFIAQKISATFASLGTPSLYLHPADALHGDLGRVAAGDVLLILSHSGETEEVVRLIDPAKRFGAEIAAITAEASSRLGRAADWVLEIGLQQEVGSGLAPTTSTTVMLGIGDALAIAVLERRGFSAEHFALVHPGGSLGKKLLRVHEVMRKDAMVPRVQSDAPLAAVIAVMTETPGRPGAALVVTPHGQLVGVFTDGDLRRLIERGQFDLALPVDQVMCIGPKTVAPELPVSEAAQLLREHRIDQVPVIDGSNRPVGLLDVQDLLALRLL